MSAAIKTSPSVHHMQSIGMTGNVAAKVKSSANTGNSQSSKQLEFDRATISSFGINLSKGNASTNKISLQIKTLMEQKENLLERKSKTMSNMLEQGRSPETIKEATKEIDDMLEELDRQITKIQLEEQQKSMGLDEESQKGKSDSVSCNTNANSPGSKNSLSSDTLYTLISADSSIKQIENVKAAKANTEGKARTLKKEIELDESRSLNGKASENKYKELDELEQRISDLTEDIAEKTSAVNEKVSESADNESTNEAVDENTGEIKDRKDAKSDNSKDGNSIQNKGSNDAALEKNIPENSTASSTPNGKTDDDKK